MDFGLSEAQGLLVESLTRALRDHAPLARTRRFVEDAEARAADLWQALAGLGLPGLVIAEAHGGSGLDLLDAALVAETLGRHVAPLPYVASAVVVPLALDRAGSPAQRAEWGSKGVTAPPRNRGYSLAGVPITTQSTLGLATAGAALKLVSESVGIMPFKV